LARRHLGTRLSSCWIVQGLLEAAATQRVRAGDRLHNVLHMHTHIIDTLK
jgi:hypothetical protein